MGNTQHIYHIYAPSPNVVTETNPDFDMDTCALPSSKFWLNQRRHRALAGFVGTLICAGLSLSLSWEISVSRSQLTRAAGLRCLGTIRKGGCNLEYHGGKNSCRRHTESDLHGRRVKEIACVHHRQLAWRSGDGKMTGKLFAV